MQEPPSGLVRKRQGYATESLRKLILFFTPLRWLQLLAFILVFILCNYCGRWSWVQTADNQIYDQFLKVRPASKVSPAIVYIGIDRKSLQAIKPFPWPKRYYAAMTRILREWGAKAIVYNLFFASSGDTPEDNQALLEEFRKVDNLYLPMSLESEGFRNYYFLSQSDPVFTERAKSVGHIGHSEDPDGVVRRVFPFVKFNQKIIPHLGLKIACDYLGKSLDSPKDCDFPRDPNNNLMIHWTRWGNDAAAYFSFSDVLNSYALSAKGEPAPIRAGMFKDKICLIGFTMSDFRKTPFESNCPGIGVTGNVINTVLTGEFIRTVPPGTFSVLLLVLACVTGLLFFLWRDTIAFLGGGALIAVWTGLSLLAFVRANLWVGVAAPVLLILLYYFISHSLNMIASHREQLRFLNLAARDELTGLYAMRYVSTLLPQTMAYANTFKKPFSVILFEVDDFKKIHDVYGYRIGNMVLKKVADAIHRAIRTHNRAVPDMAARYGEAEFIVLLVGYNLATATFGIAERIRKVVEKVEIQVDGQPLRATVSAGVSVLKRNEKDPIQVIERAQTALQKAKSEGRNRTAIVSD